MGGSGKTSPVTAIGIAGAYVLLATVLPDPARNDPTSSPLWLAAGVALGGLTVWGIRLWPVVTISSLLASAWLETPPAAAAVVALARTSEAVFGATLLRHFRSQRRAFASSQGLLRFLGFGVLVPSIAASLAGGVALRILGLIPTASLTDIWVHWAVGDSLGILVMGSFILAWRERPVTPMAGDTFSSRVAFGVALGVLVASGLPPELSPGPRLVRLLLLAALMFWSGSIFGARGATTLSLMLFCAYLVRSANGYPFYVAAGGAVDLVGFLLTTALLALVPLSLATVARQRAQLSTRLERQKARLSATVKNLATRDDHLQRAQKLAHLGSYEVNLVTGETYWSEEMLKLLGVEPSSDLLSMTGFVDRFIHPSDRGRMRDTFRRALEESGELEIQCRVIRPDGEVRHVQTSIQFTRDESGSMARGVGTLRDVTDAFIVETKLQKKQKTETLGSLAGGIAHDMNNLLWVILGNAERLERRVGSGEANASLVGEIKTAGARASELVDRILRFARATDATGERANLTAISKEALPLVQRLAPANIEVRFEQSEEPLWVRGDTSQLTQILMNLCTNALTAIHGDGTLTIRLRATANGDAVLEVEDTGIGIPPENLERVFDPLFTTAAPGRGTGLGLATVAAIVGSNGGRVEVGSKVGNGSRFQVHLPTTAPGPDDDEPPSPSSVPNPLPSNRARILVVDDEPQVLQLMMRLLRDSGHETTSANDAREALEILRSRRHDFDLMLTDQQMPGMTGDALIEAARQTAPGLPAILVSGYHDPFNANDPPDDVLRKPLGPNDLVDRVDQVLRSERAVAFRRRRPDARVPSPADSRI